ncbi:MAG: hypothetical protein ABSG68_21940 [Thermoguttaceae bacterium]|jgi:hypothetical protein
MAINERYILAVLRWTARVVGTAILALIAAIAIGEGVHPARLFETLPVALLTVAMLTMVVGLVVAWKWERIGGVLILGGLAFFAIVNHGVRLNLVFGPILAVGLLYLGYGWGRGNAAARPSSPS